MKTKKKIKLAIHQDVKTAYNNLEDAKQRLKVTQSSIHMAEESLALVKKRYEGGSESVTRYLEAELARNRAWINRTTAFYDKKIAISDIGRSMGLLSEIWK